MPSIFQAIEAADLNGIEEKINMNININAPDNNSTSPLQHAVNKALELNNKNRSNSIKIVKRLLEAEADPNVANDRQETLLHQLCCLKSYHRFFELSDSNSEIEEAAHEILRAILDKKPKLDEKDKDNNTPLLTALHCHDDTSVMLLINAGANLTVCDVQGRNPLHFICQNKNTELVNSLLERKVPLNAGDKKGFTPLDLARHPNMILFLLKRQAQAAKADLIDFFKIAQEANHQLLIDYLFAQGLTTYTRQNGLTALHVVINAALTHRLISAGAKINAKERDNNQTPLLSIVASGQFQRKSDELLTTINHFIAVGADFRTRDARNNTVLHLLVNLYLFYDNPVLLSVILNTAVEKDGQNSELQTALHIAASQGLFEVMSLLLDNDVNTQLVDNKTQIALEKISMQHVANHIECVKQAQMSATICSRLLAKCDQKYVPINSQELIQIAILANNDSLWNSLIARGVKLKLEFSTHNQNVFTNIINRNDHLSLQWIIYKIAKEPQFDQIRQEILGHAIYQLRNNCLQVLFALITDKSTPDDIKYLYWKKFFEGLQYCSFIYKTADEQVHAIIKTLKLLLANGLTLNDKIEKEQTLLEHTLNQYPPPWFFIQILVHHKAVIPRDINLLYKLMQFATLYRDHKTLEAVILQIQPLFLKQNMLSFAAVIAIQHYDLATLQFLKQQGLNINLPVQYQLEFKKYLIEYAFDLTDYPTQQNLSDDDQQKTEKKVNIICYLIREGSVLHFPIPHNTMCILDEQSTLLHRAAANGYVQVIELLLQTQYQFHPDLLNIARQTALHIATTHHFVKAVMQLLSLKANAKILMSDKKNLLHIVCEQGKIELIEPLIDAGVPLNAICPALFGFENLPIHEALYCRNEQLREPMALLLLQHGSPVDSRVITSVIYSNLSMELFKRIIAMLQLQDITMIKLLHSAIFNKREKIAMFLKDQFPILMKLRNGSGALPLHLATASGNENIYRQLVTSDADQNAIDYMGNSVATYAICYGTAKALDLKIPEHFNIGEFEKLRMQLQEEPEFANKDQHLLKLELGLLCYRLINLFQNANDILAYIRKFRNNQSRQPIQDLCLFHLPMTGQWDRKKWVNLAFSYGPELTAYLHLAPRIEILNENIPNDLDRIKEIGANIKYNREAEDPQLAALFAHYLIPEHAFNRTLDSYKPKKTDHIPNITIDGKSFNEPRFYFIKLPSDDRLGLALGPATHCCQGVGSAGESCAWHGMMSPLGGFYVVYKRIDPNDISKQQKLYDAAKQSNTTTTFIESFTLKTQKQKFQRYIMSIAEELEQFQHKKPDDKTVLIALRQKLLKELDELKNSRGEIVAQSWVWMVISQTRKILVIDSWERLRKEDDRLCEPFLSRLAEQVIEQFNFDEVLLGKGGQTPDNLSYKMKEIPVSPQDYYDYRDSRQQLIVDTKEAYLLRRQAQYTVSQIPAAAESALQTFQREASDANKLLANSAIFSTGLPTKEKTAYTSEEMNYLLSQVLAELKNLTLLSATTLSDLLQKNKINQSYVTLLTQFSQMQTTEPAILILPIINTETKFWTCLHIAREHSEFRKKCLFTITYLDFSALSMPYQLEHCLHSLGFDRNCSSTCIVGAAYNDNPILSGPWLVETLKRFAITGQLLTQPLPNILNLFEEYQLLWKSRPQAQSTLAVS